jgi:hypothetical protein
VRRNRVIMKTANCSCIEKAIVSPHVLSNVELINRSVIFREKRLRAGAQVPIDSCVMNTLNKLKMRKNVSVLKTALQDASDTTIEIPTSTPNANGCSSCECLSASNNSTATSNNMHATVSSNVNDMVDASSIALGVSGDEDPSYFDRLTYYPETRAVVNNPNAKATEPPMSAELQYVLTIKKITSVSRHVDTVQCHLSSINAASDLDARDSAESTASGVRVTPDNTPPSKSVPARIPNNVSDGNGPKNANVNELSKQKKHCTVS